MPEIDGVNVVPVDKQAQEMELLRNDARLLSAELTKERRRLARVRNVAKELRTVAPHAAILIEGALER